MRPIPALLRSGLALALAPWLTSCDLEFPEQEIHLRQDAKADRLDLLFIAKGLSAEDADPKSIAAGVQAVQRLLQGRREFMVIDWPWYVDFEDMAERAQGLESEARAAADAFPPQRRAELAWARQFLGIMDLVEVTRTGLYQDPEGRLCGYQLVRIRELSRFLAWLNRQIAQDILDKETLGTLVREVEGDEETARRWAAKARAGTPWVTFDEGAMIIDVPMSETLLSQNIAWMIHETMGLEEKDRWFGEVAAEFLRHTRSARLGDQGLYLVLGHSSGTTVMNPTHPDRTYDPSLARALAEQGVGPEEGMTLEQVRALLPDPVASGSAR